MTQYFERRKHKRYTANGGTLVLTGKPLFFNLGKPRFIKFGPLVNISKGGIQTQYLSSKERSDKYNVLSINMPADDLKLDNICFETITDFQKTEFLKTKKIRQRCIKFNELTDTQKFQLDYFLSHHTTGPVKDRRSKQDRRQSDSRFNPETSGIQKDRRVPGERRRYAI